MNLDNTGFLFALDSGLQRAELLATLQDGWHCHVQHPRAFRRDWYDSFDHRLYRQGLVLTVSPARAAGTAPALLQLDLRRLLSAELIAQGFCKQAPAFPTDLPDGRLRRELCRILKVRALLPLCGMEGEQQWIDILNKTGKIIARIALERMQDAALPELASIHPVRGYDKAARRLRQLLGEQLQLPPPGSDPIELISASTGMTLASYSNKPGISIGPEMSAAEASARVLLKMLELMETNEGGVIAEVDTEFLHDFRIAIRKTRALLVQMRKLFPEPVQRRFRRDFAWLAGVTSRKRDLDVFLLDFDTKQGLLKPGRRRHLEPLRDYLLLLARREQLRLKRSLSTKRYQRLKTDWREFLLQVLEQGLDTRIARQRIPRPAGKAIWKLYKKVLAEGDAISDISPVTELHELRKTCKKLRYLLENFQTLYPDEAIGSVLSEFKRLQDRLGAITDLDVQQGFIRAWEDDLKARGAGDDTLTAMDKLIDRLAAAELVQRDKFQATFKAFASKQNRRLFKKLFHQRDQVES